MRPLTRGEQLQARAAGGLLVERSQGAAARAGIAASDILLAINAQPVVSAEQIRRALVSSPKQIALLIQRDDQRSFVPIRLG